MKNKTILKISEAAEILNISIATVHNWIKSGLLIIENNGISKDSVERLIRDIDSGKIKRLNSRANKKSSTEKFIPQELLSNKEAVSNLQSLIYKIKENNLSIDKFISDLLNYKKGISTKSFSTFIKNNRHILEIEPEILYQSLRIEGGKSKDGSYFTPNDIVEDILNDIKVKDNYKIYDPCCGTGQFLKAINLKFKSIEIFGKDIDPIAVKIVKCHFTPVQRNQSFFENTDSLLINEDNKYDMIITNPPWGAHYSKSERKTLDCIFPESDSGDSLEYFLLKGFHSLKEKGIMSYILPESFLYVKRFESIRKFFVENSKILKIKTYGRKFAKVFSEIIRIDIQKDKASYEHKINIENHLLNKSNDKIQQGYFLSEFNYIFNINATEKDRKILKDILLKPHVTLKDNAQWSLGIVTGNNSKFVSSKKNKDHCLPLFTGKNINPYSTNGIKQYLFKRFDNFQQVPKNNLFIAKEKLIYKFISDKLVFAYDSTQTHTLNSANILIPELKDYPMKVVMGILNSDLMNYIYQNKFKSLKVLRSSLERLPFPADPDIDTIRSLEKYIDELLEDKDDRFQLLQAKINELVYILFNIPEKHREEMI